MYLRFKCLLMFAAMMVFVPLAVAQEFSAPPQTVEDSFETAKSQLPEPPEGFYWRLYENAVFPMPMQWNEQQVAGRLFGMETATLATSPEEFSATKQFEMGFTVQAYRNSRKNMKIDATRVVATFIAPDLSPGAHNQVLILNKQVEGDFERTYFRYRNAPPGLKPIIVHKFMIANNELDSVHIFTFESPEATWAENWRKFGTPILRLVFIAWSGSRDQPGIFWNPPLEQR